ncbi:ATP-binding protein [Vibrio maerlii]|uniref:ATP-binding protein n=1 Tax=Vibrio maerlii TaxID=2231648 RepID=UPI000E3EBE78|nr:ATP-binding protein [Vibrio maerlii]
MTFVERKQNADRICEGISKIGYTFHAAIEDLVDNSIAAEATHIDIVLELTDGATTREKSKVISVRVIDNGIGMDELGLEKALDLGSDVIYKKNSLSKYGFGLKSAGFSLGRRVSVYSKQKGIYSNRHYVDRDIIKDKGVYGACIESIDSNDSFLSNYENGTVVEITKINTPHDSANKTLKHLRERLGVLYCELIKEHGIKLNIICNNGIEAVKPRDILSWDDCTGTFDPDQYDGITPKLALDREIEISGAPSIKVRAVIFPKDSMKKNAAFSEDERSAIKSYEISRKNSGFFIFRNGRLIKWGDGLGISSRDDINFRATISLETAHDEVLHVDVSKQNLELSEQFLDSLQLACRVPLSQAESARALCGIIEGRNGEKEGKKTNDTLEVFSEEDPDIDYSPVNKEEQKARRKKNNEESKKNENEGGSYESNEAPKDNKINDSDDGSFKKIRYTDAIFKSVIFKSEYDEVEGVYIRINKNHLFYQLILSSLPEGDKTRVAIEGLLYSLALGEKKTEENLHDLEHADILKVFEKYHRVASYNMENWASGNQDIFN